MNFGVGEDKESGVSVDDRIATVPVAGEEVTTWQNGLPARTTSR